MDKERIELLRKVRDSLKDLEVNMPEIKGFHDSFTDCIERLSSNKGAICISDNYYIRMEIDLQTKLFHGSSDGSTK